MKRVLIGGLIVLALAITWLLWRSDAEPFRPLAAEHVTPAGTAAPAGGQETARATTEREPIKAASAGRAASTATLRGRCVDGATGAPLPGCSVRLIGGPNSERIDAYLEQHGPVAWDNPPEQTTGADGIFAFTFVPPAPYQFGLGIQAPGIVRIHGQWQELAPGTVEDLGDIPMHRGTTVSGTVADSAGVPQAPVQVGLQRHQNRGANRLGTYGSHQATTRPDGTFTFAKPVAFGKWQLQVHGRQVVAPGSALIPDGQAVTMLAIETKPLGEIKRIAGVVVDAEGAPVEGAELFANDHYASSTTDQDGRFRIEQQPGESDAPVRLSFRCTGFEHLSPEAPCAWGSEDLRFVMQRGLAIPIVVVDAETGKSIENYAVRCFPASYAGGMELELRDAGRHPSGRATITGLRRGPQILVVEPASDVWQPSGFVRFELTDERTSEQTVALSRTVTNTLRLVRASGAPVEGAEVELLHALGPRPVSLSTPRLAADQLDNDLERVGRTLTLDATPDAARLIMTGLTDRRGEMVLRGPSRTSLVLRIRGPGHPAILRPDVVLTAGAPALVITVPTGATVQGTLGPPGLLDWYPPSAARLARAGDRPAERQKLLAKFRPSVVLRREPAEEYPALQPLDEHGAFTVEGLPPGTWDLHLSFWIDDRSGPRRAREFLQTLADLEEGEVRKVTADLRHLEPARITGTVLRNGAPLESGRITLVGTPANGRAGPGSTVQYQVEPGPGGAFAIQVRPATYRVGVWLPSARRTLPAAGHVAVHPGQVLQQVFHVGSGALHLRIRNRAGEPVSGIKVRITDLDGTWFIFSTVTDLQGRTRLDPAPAGVLALSVVPKRLVDHAAATAFRRANAQNPNALEEAMVSLGRAEVAAGGEPTEVELVLPASAGY